MADLTVNSALLGLKNVSVHVDDYGASDGRPVVLIHGWPLSGKSWSEQIQSLTAAGLHVITYDRRGFGDSDKPSGGYDYDTFADDLNGLLEKMDLHDVSLVGFSMGGGEVARYIAKFGEDRLRSVVFASAVPPYLAKTDDNPEGPLSSELAEQMKMGLEANETVFYESFLKQFFSPNGDGNVLVSDTQMADAIALTAQADKVASCASMNAFATTDFRKDLQKITVPTLVIHGDADGIVPFDGSGKLTHEQVAGSQLHVIMGAPHGMNVSHANEFNQALTSFLQK
jgi:non-heme chloroperoxidase